MTTFKWYLSEVKYLNDLDLLVWWRNLLINANHANVFIKLIVGLYITIKILRIKAITTTTTETTTTDTTENTDTNNTNNTTNTTTTENTNTTTNTTNEPNEQTQTENKPKKRKIGGYKKMHDIYLIHKQTGDLVPYTAAFNEWNKKPHNYLESIFDNYIETNMPVENSELAAPDFIGCINRQKKIRTDKHH